MHSAIFYLERKSALCTEEKNEDSYEIRQLFNTFFFLVNFPGETTCDQSASTKSQQGKKNDSEIHGTKNGSGSSQTTSETTFQQRKEEAKSRRRKKKKTDSSVVATTFQDLYHMTNEILGQGAYASVRTCRNIWTDQEFAVKIIGKSSLALESSQGALFLQF